MNHNTPTINQNHKTDSSGIFYKLKLVLRHFCKIPLDLYSCMASGGYRLSLWRSRTLRTSAIFATFMLVILVSVIMIPVHNNISITEAKATPSDVDEMGSTLVMNVTKNVAAVDLSVTKDNGSFTSSTTPISFDITTTNYTGYTLSIKNSKTTTDLVNNTANGSYTNDSNKYATLSSITSATSSSTFSADDVATANSYNGKYGLLYSKLNSSTNTSYQPSPTSTTATTLDKTTVANSSANTYTIGIGARASYAQPAGTYTGTYTLAAVGNAVAYSIKYTDNTSDSTVANLPYSSSDNIQSGSVSATSVTLSSTAPTRTGYTFSKWCTSAPTNSGTTCSGNAYSAEATYFLDQTTGNAVTLYATWAINSNNVTLTRVNNIINITLGSGSSTTNSSTTSSFNYGSTVTMSATKASNTTCITYGTPSWTVTSGGVSLSTTSGTSTAFTMPNNAVAVTVSSTATRNPYTITYDANGGTGTMSNTSAYCGQAVTLRANTFIRSGYTFLGWSTSSSATTATYTDKQSITLSRTSTLTLYAVWEKNIVTIAAGPTTTMQSISSKADGGCPDTLTTGTAYTLTDSRDGQTYRVARLADGNCWLLDNLALGAVALKQTLSVSNTNMSSSVSFTLPSSNASDFSSLVEAQINTAYANELDIKPHGASGNEKVGVYYNYCAATAGTYCDLDNTNNAEYDICPAGWRMPTGGYLGEYHNLLLQFPYSVSESVNARFEDALRVALTGYYMYVRTYSRGKYGVFWSSTYSGSNRYMLTLQITTSGIYADTPGAVRSQGNSVRCVLK